MATDTPTDLRWLDLINDFRRSGLTHAEFCSRRAISLHTFRKRLYGQKALAPALDRKRDKVPIAPARFLPVTLEHDDELSPVPPADPLAILLPGGRRIVVGKGFDPETLRRLIDAIEPGR
jgi:hypothetical protein